MEITSAKVEDIKGSYFYKDWLKREGLRVIEDFYQGCKNGKVRTLEKKGRLGVYLKGDIND